ncbi:prenyltransferase [Serpentinicella sp. ANB-PHB4]|uniref:prenyltransferase n=1 Tax=Serpentinicella sp. ANB-PHB4 TaxID=3074076 RepID=UPI00286615BC|nr:prenyltransferase [Serpentinicella sp. ANB-PHB4]MDR5658389.1 prenyltransferase [Serpentinicella sp. ANB-PHB4]
MNKAEAWTKASRIPAQMFIFPSLLLGQIIHFSMHKEFNWLVFVLIHTYGLLMHLFIVYANDYADYETDRQNKTFTPFTGGSRVLIEGYLSKKNILYGAVVMAIMCLFIGVLLSFYIGNAFILLLVIAGILLLYAYSFSPMKISYRGFGELLQMIGVGLVLPLIGYLSQGGNINAFPWTIIIIILPSQLAMAISTSLPDEPSDRLSSKRTSVVILGHYKAKLLIILLYTVSFISILIYQRGTLINLSGIIFSLITSVLILLQLFILSNYSIKPGSKMITYFVLLSILTNTVIVLGLSYIIFKHA